MGAGDRRQPIHRVEHAGRRLGVHERDNVGRRCAEGALERVRLAGTSPLHVETGHRRAISAAHLGESIPEVACDHDERARSFLHEIGNHGLHARCAGPRHCQRQRPGRRAEEPAEAGPDVIEHGEHDGIKDADCR